MSAGILNVALVAFQFAGLLTMALISLLSLIGLGLLLLRRETGIPVNLPTLLYVGVVAPPLSRTRALRIPAGGTLTRAPPGPGESLCLVQV